MIWKLEYKETYENIQVEGFSTSGENCKAYLANRVSSKITEADSSEQLRSHLAELETTGFNSGELFAQTIDSQLHVKDWEIGEAIAETVLEDEHEAMFPWETGWDKRTLKANLPGADIVGFQHKKAPRFIFGQVKSSSETRVPPQIINSSNDCLKNQMHHLLHKPSERMQLIAWLLLRVKGTDWMSAFKEALENYAQKDYCIVGVLVSGGRTANPKDLTGICTDIQHTNKECDMSLLGYYLPLDKEEWHRLLQRREVS